MTSSAVSSGVFPLRIVVSAVLAPNVLRSVATSASFVLSAAFSESALVLVTSESTFTSCTFAAVSSVVIAVHFAFCAAAELRADMSELKLGAKATSPVDTFFVVSCACEIDGVAMATTAAVASAESRVRFFIGDSSLQTVTRHSLAPVLPVRRVVKRFRGPPGREQDQGHIGHRDAKISHATQTSIMLVIHITNAACVRPHHGVKLLVNGAARVTQPRQGTTIRPTVPPSSSSIRGRFAGGAHGPPSMRTTT